MLVSFVQIYTSVKGFLKRDGNGPVNKYYSMLTSIPGEMASILRSLESVMKSGRDSVTHGYRYDHSGDHTT